VLTGAGVEGYRLDGDIGAALEDAHRRAEGRARTLIVSFPHNPTGAVATPELMQRIVDFAREHELLVVHDFAYADLAYDGHEPPSILSADGAREVAIELYSLTKGFSMAGWRVGFAVGNAEVLAGLARLKSYLDYGTFQPIQIAAIVAMNEAADYPREVCEVYRSRRDSLCRGLERTRWPVEPPPATMFVWAPIPERFRAEGSQAFALRLLREAKVAVSPGVGFGPAGEGYVRFALVENEQRIAQAVRGIRSVVA
jgi:alanine-synthesizing transaminase